MFKVLDFILRVIENNELFLWYRTVSVVLRRVSVWNTTKFVFSTYHFGTKWEIHCRGKEWKQVDKLGVLDRNLGIMVAWIMV